MPRSTVTFVCTECGGETLRWAGQCPHCQAWNTLQEFVAKKASAARRQEPRQAGSARPVPLTEISMETSARHRLECPGAWCWWAASLGWASPRS
jgi:DNA repair protein RadA/Sms